LTIRQLQYTSAVILQRVENSNNVPYFPAAIILARHFIAYSKHALNIHNPVTNNPDTNTKIMLTAEYILENDTRHLGRQMSHLSVQTKFDSLQIRIIAFKNKYNF
jgi:hypothetical protein